MSDETAFGLPLVLNAGGLTISPINTVVITKGMDSEGDIVYAVAMTEGLDLMDALALIHYGRIDVEARVSKIVAPNYAQTE